MQSIPAAHYCFSAEIITMKNNAGYWLRVVFFSFPPLLFCIYVVFIPPPPRALQFYLSKKSDRWSDARSSRSKKQAVSLRQSFILSSSGSVSSLRGGGGVFNCSRYKWVTSNQRVYWSTGVSWRAAETWRAAGFDSVLYIYISNLLTSRLIILKSVYINSLRVTRVTVRLHFGWQCLQYPSHTG